MFQTSKNWVKYKNNPVLGDITTGSLFDPFVVRENDRFKMYLSWRLKDSVAYTYSYDGISWDELKVCLGPNPYSKWEHKVNRATVVFKDNKYYMWYTGQAEGFSKIGIAHSDDGKTFNRIQKEPVLEPEFPFEGFSVMNPHVIWDENKYKMWYAAGETYEPNVICYAESLDGVNWKKYSQNPIITHGSKEDFDCDRVGGCEVHKLPDGSYIMFYIGYTDIDTARIGIKTSLNGIDWKPYKDNPIVSPSEGEFDGNACYKPSVYIGDNTIMLWYNGRLGDSEAIGMVYKKFY